MLRFVQRYPVLSLGLLSLITFWPIVIWYGQRLLGTDGEYWSLLALVTGFVQLVQTPIDTAKHPALWPASLLLLLYCLTYWFLPTIFNALLALLTLAALLTVRRDLRRIPVAIWGLFLLALPVVASLQFYAGYPLRVMAGEIAVLLLQMNGMQVVREGVVLNWGGQLVSIDAPCSGINMLWSGLFMSCVLAGFYRLRLMPTAYLLLLTLGIVIAGNALRVTSLFYVETGLVPDMQWAHDSIGLMTYVFIALPVAWLAQYFTRRQAPCPACASM